MRLNFGVCTLVLVAGSTAAFVPSKPVCPRGGVALRAEVDATEGWFRRLSKFGAQLSLRDAAWRKKLGDTDVDMAAFEGDEAGPATSALNALGSLVQAETARAEKIVAGDGGLVRPKDMSVLGPLGEAERRTVLALENLVAAERERARAGAAAGKMVRPRDAPHPEMLSVLGELEKDTAAALLAISEAEKRRVAEGGAFGRPADQKGGRSILGDIEDEARKLVAAEVGRLEAMLETGDLTLRPMDLPADSPLAKAERRVLATADSVRAYELARLAQLRAKGLLPARPMEAAPDSPAGLAERLTVGLLRAPLVLERLVARTAELLRAAEGAADAEHAARKAEEKKARAAALRRRQLGEAKEAAERGPQLASAVLKRTQELLKENREGGEA